MPFFLSRGFRCLTKQSSGPGDILPNYSKWTSCWRLPVCWIKKKFEWTLLLDFSSNNLASALFFLLLLFYRFQYVLAAATSIATKVTEETLTYLNQGQSYEIKLKKLGDLSNYRGRVLKAGFGFHFLALSLNLWNLHTRVLKMSVVYSC